MTLVLEALAVADLDAPVFSALARLHRAGELDADGITTLLQRLAPLAAGRLPITDPLVLTAWSFRDDVDAGDRFEFGGLLLAEADGEALAAFACLLRSW